MTYVFRCPECERTIESSDRVEPMCQTDWVVMTRDYRAEGANLIPPR